MARYTANLYVHQDREAKGKLLAIQVVADSVDIAKQKVLEQCQQARIAHSDVLSVTEQLPQYLIARKYCNPPTSLL